MEFDLTNFAKKKEQVTDVVVRIDAVEEPRSFGDEKIVYLKFMVANEKALRIQCMALEKEIERIGPFIRRNNIIRIKGATSKKEYNPKNNDGDVPFILMINSNTSITLIKDCDSDDDNEEDTAVRNFVKESSNLSFESRINRRHDLDLMMTVINNNTAAMKELAAVIREGRRNF